MHPSQDSNQALDEIYTALAHTKRRAMVLHLAYAPATVKQLADEQELSLSAMHKHVRMLQHSGLIEAKKVGRTNFLAIRRAGLVQAQQWLGQFHAMWGSDSETLENYIANLQDNPTSK